MDDLAFPEEPEYAISKAEVVASTFKNSLPLMKRFYRADKAYIAMIGFAGDAKILGIFKASELSDSREYWDVWFRKSVNDVRYSFGGGTNITSALKLARELYDGALKGDLESYGIHNFSPMYQNIVIGNYVYDIANVRVFVYFVGKSCTDDEFVNCFKDASLVPGKTNVSGVTSVFLGNTEAGYQIMESIAGVCPIHGVKAVIHVNRSKNYEDLRELLQIFHTAAATSGFCVQCGGRRKSILL